jgi:hypothetical protein
MKAPRSARFALVVSMVATAGCGDTNGGNPGGTQGPTAGAPIEGLTSGVWNWVPVDGARCADGSSTGIGINPGSADLLVFLEGGGACWDFQSCVGSPLIVTRGPFGAMQLQIRSAAVTGSIFDRAAPGNPFATWTLVYVPYCTADVHAGDKVTTYRNAAGDHETFDHVGHANIVAALSRLAPTYPSPPRLVVSGSSAGGFGTFASYATFRATWPTVKGYLIDDSGPAVPGISQAQRDAFFSSWNLGDTTDAFCPGCRADLTAGYTALASGFHDDRMALLSYTQDMTISFFFQMPATTFQTGLHALATDTLSTLPTWRTYFQSGTSHTMLGNLAAHTQNGVALTTFLTQMVSDDAAWESVAAP